MLKVYRLNDDEFIITAGKRALYGNKTKTVIALSEIGVPWSEIETGIISLCINDHKVANYGVNQMFIYSDDI